MRAIFLASVCAALLISACARQATRDEPAKAEGKPSTPLDPVICDGYGRPDAKTSTALINEVLDDFHDAASKADFGRYFGHFAADGVFLGTDPAERWTLEEFRAYAKPHFDQGRGWTYLPVERHVVIAADGRTAWFDEKLSNAKYGLCRGTGVLTRDGAGAWRIRHYSLTFLIRNEVAEQATGLGR